MSACKEQLNGDSPPYRVGHVRGVRPGDSFLGRGELAAVGIHRQILSGIESKKGFPCSAVVMSGGYKDDDDGGLQFWYTGQGGRTGKKHTHDQELKSVRPSAHRLPRLASLPP